MFCAVSHAASDLDRLSCCDALLPLQVDDTVTVVAEISILSESVTFVRDAELPPTGLVVPSSTDVLGGKFTWKASPVHTSLTKLLI